MKAWPKWRQDNFPLAGRSVFKLWQTIYESRARQAGKPLSELPKVFAYPFPKEQVVARVQFFSASEKLVKLLQNIFGGRYLGIKRV